jgi:transcriptional regulator with XRE-family HTH domain
VEKIGAKLRAVRVQSDLSLRDVGDQASQIATMRGNPLCKISASWLDRIERENRSIGSTKLLTLALIYNLTIEELLSFGDALDKTTTVTWDLPISPKSTLLLPRGPLDEKARILLPDETADAEPPKATDFLDSPAVRKVSRYVRAVIGSEDNFLHPMLRSGATVLIDRQKRTIAPNRVLNNEFERPIYLLETRDGYICSWCEFDERERNMLVIVPHPCSGRKGVRLRMTQDVTVIGLVTGLHMRVEPLS